MKKIFYKTIIILILFLLYLFIDSYSYAISVSNDLSSNIFRLHIIANSDKKNDQELKLKIRNEIIEYLNPKLKNCKTKKEVISIVSKNLDELEKISVDTIKKNGYKYNVKLKIGNFKFPTKYYGNISMPAGNYDALRIEIGKAQGQNWWCSLFPSLCFTKISNGYIDKDGQNNLKINLNNEEYNILTDKKAKYQIKFKIIELFNH